METRVLEIRKGILNKNDEIARRLRERLHACGLLTINLVSSPGSGKTAFLQRSLKMLRESGVASAALVGDLATDNDAKRLAEAGVPVKQINTDGRCHLEAQMISDHLADWDLGSFEYLFIENVGNLVCPSSYDLGEDVRVVLLSVTEGEDKPLKYPNIFNSADIALITKMAGDEDPEDVVEERYGDGSVAGVFSPREGCALHDRLADIDWIGRNRAVSVVTWPVIGWI
jgi:hydrogenase nickel incorporation protein HypB